MSEQTHLKTLCYNIYINKDFITLNLTKYNFTNLNNSLKKLKKKTIKIP